MADYANSISFDLSGRVAIVTGGNGGIGLAMARALTVSGARVIVAGRDLKKGAAAVSELGNAVSEFVNVDVKNQAACRKLVDRALDRFGRLDILINNAGMSIRKRPEAYLLEEWHSVIETNLTSAFLCSQAAYPAMCRVGGGKIINIGSLLSVFGTYFSAPYAASKGGLVQLTKALATAWAADGIQVNAVLPGWIDTDLTRATRREVPGLEEKVLGRTPAGRWGKSEDLAGIAVFLSARASDFITGAVIPVDGGYSVQG